MAETKSEDEQHNANITLALLLGCTVLFASLSYYAKTLLAEKPYRQKLTHGLISAGVAVRRVVRTTREIERKLFHVAGLLVPLVYWTLTYGLGWPKWSCVKLCICITTAGFCYDAVRAFCPSLGLNRPVMRILREKELTRISGAPYFALGSATWVEEQQQQGFTHNCCCAQRDLRVVVVGPSSCLLISPSRVHARDLDREITRRRRGLAPLLEFRRPRRLLSRDRLRRRHHPIRQKEPRRIGKKH
jgi:hypothetical protein